MGFRIILKANEMLWRCTEAKCQFWELDALKTGLDLCSIVLEVIYELDL